MNSYIKYDVTVIDESKGKVIDVTNMDNKTVLKKSLRNIIKSMELTRKPKK